MNRQKFDDALWKAFKLDFHLCQEFNLKILNNHYCLPPGAPLQCHPLECVLLGEEAGGTVQEDIAERLECSLEFVEGFGAGWADNPEAKKPSDCCGKDYQAGFNLALSRDYRIF